MTDQERDTLLLDIRDRLKRIENTQSAHGLSLRDHGSQLEQINQQLVGMNETLRNHGVRLVRIEQKIGVAGDLPQRRPEPRVAIARGAGL